MLRVPVVGSTGKPLMPCHPARCRELVRKGRAVRRFNKGIFYIKLLDREDGELQEVAVGIDPGSKKEALTVKSMAHTYLNIQVDAITWVSRRIEQRRTMRRNRRSRNCPHRACRSNRSIGGIPPSTRARWDWKLRICKWLSKLYPITKFIVEDIKARTRKGGRKWNRSFSPLEVGKRWFYEELNKIASVETRQGYETKELRDGLGLKKSSKKLAEIFEAHCVDSWVLANWWVGGHLKPDSKDLLCLVPLQFHRRQLHKLEPRKGGIRSLYGGTNSLGFKRGSWVQHSKYGICYIGGFLKNRLSLHSLLDGKRLCQNAKPTDCKFLTHSSWRMRLLPAMNDGVSVA